MSPVVLIELAGVAAIAFIASLAVCRAMISAGPLDVPTESRKAHSAPTPTGGGVGIALGFAAGMIALSLFSWAWRSQVSGEGMRLLWVTALFAYPLMLVGFIDDIRHIDAKIKFVLYAVLSLAAAWMAGVVETIPYGGQTLHLPFAVGLVGTALWMFTMVNAVNFMDGANGIAMGSVAVGLIALTAIAFDRGSPAAAALAICATAALLGFLVWNYPHGRLFAGDAGALFASAIGAFGSLILIARTDLSPLVPPLLFFPLLSDALLTLLFRARRGRSLLVGHAEHVYQLARAGGVKAIAVTYWVATALCGAVAYAVSQDATGFAPLVALVALSGLALAVDIFVRRWALQKGILAD